jgi:predicted MFS family arabinose efflux permease
MFLPGDSASFPGSLKESDMSTRVESTEIEAASQGQRRLMLAIVIGPFLGNMIMLAPPPFFPLISAELGISVPLLGQVMTGMLLLSTALALIVGPLADRYGHRRMMLIGAGAAISSLIAFGVAQSYAVLILAGLIGGLATASLPGLGVAVATSLFSGQARRRALGWSSSAGAGAAVVGVPVLVAIADIFGWRIALVVTGLLAIGSIWIISSAVPGPRSNRSERFSVEQLRASYRPLFHHPPSLRVVVATVMRTICWSGYLTYLSTLMHRELGLSTSQIGVMFFIGGAAYIGASLNARRVLGLLALRQMVALANGLMAVLVALVLSGIPGYWATLVLIPLTGIAAGIGWVSIVTLMAEESPAESGTTMALNGAAFNLGAAGGGAIGGVLLATGGFPVTGLVLMIAAFSAAFLVMIPARESVPASTT